MSTVELNPLQTAFVGAMLGTMVGDQLGAPFEGWSAVGVAGYLNDLSDNALAVLLDRTNYTDDTQMMIGVAETLIDCGRLDTQYLASRFAENYEPHRGYGAGAHAVIRALVQGVPYDKAATIVFPDGSFGNGAAMRVAPVGLFYHQDGYVLRLAAELSARVTHVHPLGVEGAVLQALAVATAIDSPGSISKRRTGCSADRLRSGDDTVEDQPAVQPSPNEFDPKAFVGNLSKGIRAEMDEYGTALKQIDLLLDGKQSIDTVFDCLGNDIRAHRSVPAAVYAFLSHPHSFAAAVRYAISLGGDADTIGAMTGAIAGAYHGVQGIPHAWLDALEGGAKGREYVSGLAVRLADKVEPHARA